MSGTQMSGTLFDRTLYKCSPVFHTGSLFHPEFSDIVSVHVRTQTSETNNHNEVC